MFWIQLHDFQQYVGHVILSISWVTPLLTNQTSTKEIVMLVILYTSNTL